MENGSTSTERTDTDVEPIGPIDPSIQALERDPGTPAVPADNGNDSTEPELDLAAIAPIDPEDGETPADPRPLPEPDASGSFDLFDPNLMLNRELTWLNFNFRVLAQAEDSRTPLLERLNFISIVGSNLDEFFMKRIGGLKQQLVAGVLTPSDDGRTPAEQLEEAYGLIRVLVDRQREVLAEVMAELDSHRIRIVDAADLDAAAREELRERYVSTIYPLVTPQASDPTHPFPFVSNLSLNLLVALRLPDEDISSIARIKVPIGPGIPRFLQIGESHVFVPVESVMEDNLDLLFPGLDIVSHAFFRVTRNADTEIEGDEADDLLAYIETELRHRRLAPIVRLEISAGMDPVHRGMLAAELGLDEVADVFEVDGLIGLRDFAEIAGLDLLPLRYEPHQPLDAPALVQDRSVFHTVRDRGSVLVYHPYESFNASVERFLKEAAHDPKVRAIKMTVYRTSSDSRAVEHLIDAARNGKQVAVVMELKARFDEAANIRWANRLSAFGIHVTYGVIGLKTHGKSILVVRQDFDGLRRYAHIGTGNYHSGTARIYSDVGLLTCDDGIGADLTELFNYLTTGYKPRRDFNKLLPAPKVLKPALVAMVAREREHAREGRQALIQIKVNALEDPDITRELYRASQDGVKVDLIVRDTCRIRPGIEGLSDTIRVFSIVGRFLEHARIYHFANGGEPEYYIGSADIMRRNLSNRVEILAPVEAPDLQQELRFLLDTQLEDKRLGWEMRADGSYARRTQSEAGAPGTHTRMIDWTTERHRDATRLKRRRPRGLGG